MKKEKTHESTPIFKGDPKSFNDFIGPRLRNIIPSLTKKYKREIGKCEHCGITNIEFEVGILVETSSQVCQSELLKIKKIYNIKFRILLV